MFAAISIAHEEIVSKIIFKNHPLRPSAASVKAKHTFAPLSTSSGNCSGKRAMVPLASQPNTSGNTLWNAVGVVDKVIMYFSFISSGWSDGQSASLGHGRCGG